MKTQNIPANAGRLLNAVARIGYDVEVALCDLMDNSVDASAKQINLQIEELIEDNEPTGVISRYIIADDGSGMGEGDLINAFTLGGDRNYDDGSLGKFGLGLKSAGLSLGDKIIVLSQNHGSNDPLLAILSLQQVEQSGEYQISIGNASGEYLDLWTSYSLNASHGTVLILDDLHESHTLSNDFLGYLRRYLGQIYHMLIEDENSPITILFNGEEIPPVDPLFLSKARQNGPLGNIEEWDGKQANLLLDDTELSLGPGIACTISATNLVHPPTFEIEGGLEARNRASSAYQIDSDPYTKRPRHGFYVYRNRRIIVSAERFYGIVAAATQAWAFRARLMFDETADHALALDVKKRHLKLPKSVRSNLKSLISAYQAKSQNAWKHRGQIYSDWKGSEGSNAANVSVANTPLGSLDYNPNTNISTESELEERKKLQKNIERKSLESIQDASLTKEELEQFAAKKFAVIHADGLKGHAMWVPYPSVELGRAETILNKQHAWIADALESSEGNPEAAIILYQFLAIMSRAELEVRTTPWPNMNSKVIDKVFDIYRRKVSMIGEDVADSLSAEIENLKSGGMVGG